MSDDDGQPSLAGAAKRRQASSAKGKKRPRRRCFASPSRSANLVPVALRLKTLAHFQLWIRFNARPLFFSSRQASIPLGPDFGIAPCASTCAWRVLAMVERSWWMTGSLHQAEQISPDGCRPPALLMLAAVQFFPLVPIAQSAKSPACLRAPVKRQCFGGH